LDSFLEFITSEDFKYIAAIVIGGLISWYISKHFFFKRAPTKLSLAKRQKTTNYGDYRNLALENEEIVINHEIFGTWVTKSDGTVTDRNNRLMWIRAPWGTTWDGTHFVGEPIKMSWYDATHLFGKGSYIKGTGASLKPKQIENTANTKKYTKGTCTASFAGHSNWRLPSAFELNTLGFYTSEKVSEAYSRSSLEAPTLLREQLFPGLGKASENYFLWSADEAGSACAWAADGSWPLGDFRYKAKFFVLLVRSI